MVSLLTVQIFTILATTITNLLGILTFTSDYWSIIIYDFVKLKSYARWTIVDQFENGTLIYRNHTNETDFNFNSSTTIMNFENDLFLFRIHQGLFRQCNYLSDDVRKKFKIPKCRALKSTNNQYDDLIHGMTNPGREFIRLHNTASSCAILIVLLLSSCTLIGIIVGIINSAVLATMTVGIIYLVATMFSAFIIAIMNTILKCERKRSHCYSLEILTDNFCSSRTIEISYSFILGYFLVCCCLITSFCWLSLQEKQRKFAQH